MRIHIIACRVLTRELSYLISQSPHTVDITWLPQGLHDTPEKLRALIADAIDGLYRQREQRMLKHFPDVIVLGYGLCSNGVVGLESRDIPLVIPRTDDCIALFLGSQERYLRLFEEYNGTYWLNNGWIETAYIPSLEMKEEMREGGTGRRTRNFSWSRTACGSAITTPAGISARRSTATRATRPWPARWRRSTGGNTPNLRGTSACCG